MYHFHWILFKNKTNLFKNEIYWNEDSRLKGNTTFCSYTPLYGFSWLSIALNVFLGISKDECFIIEKINYSLSIYTSWSWIENVLTVNFNCAICLSQAVLSHAFIWAKVVRSDRFDMERHINFVRAVVQYWLVIST